MSDYIRADAWIGMSELIEELGGVPADVFAASGLHEEDLLPVERYLPIEKFVATLNNAANATGRNDFGLIVGQRRQLTEVGVVGLAMIHGSCWRHIIDIGIRIGRISNPLVTARLEPSTYPGAEYVWMDNSRTTVPNHEQAVERTVALTVNTARKLVRPDLDPVAIHFQHAQIAPMERYIEALGMAPEFNQPKTGFIITTEDLDAPIPTSNPELGGAAMQYLEATGQIGQNDFLRAARITARTLVELGEAAPHALASTLGVDLRTLQRRLKEEGSSPADIFDEARRSFAQRLLADNLHSLAQISHLLGYATSDSFNRNCKRWFGDTPAKLRGKSFKDIG